MSLHDTYIVHKQSSCFWLTVACSRLPIAVWCFTERITRKRTAAPPVSDSAVSSWCSPLHARISFQAQRLIVDSVRGPCFCSHIVNKGFFCCCFSFVGALLLPHTPLPSVPFVCESPRLLLEAFNWSPAGLSPHHPTPPPPPQPASKPDADEKFMTVCLENPSHSIWSAALPLMLPPLIATASAASIRPTLFLTAGVRTAESGWDGVRGFTLLCRVR